MLLSIKKYLTHYVKTVKPVVTKEYELNKINKLNFNKKYQKFDYVTLNIDTKVLDNNFSSSYDLLNYDDLEIGNKLHEILEYLDFSNYEEELENCPFKEKIEKLFEMPFMSDLTKVYKEIEFFDNEKNGIIDLLIETENEFIIVDYKTKEINKESYKMQVKKYIEFIKTKTNKKVVGYLYSIFDCIYIKIDG